MDGKICGSLFSPGATDTMTIMAKSFCLLSCFGTEGSGIAVFRREMKKGWGNAKEF